MFGRLKDWRRVATRYDHCPKVFLSVIALAALVIYWLCILALNGPPFSQGKILPFAGQTYKSALVKALEPIDYQIHTFLWETALVPGSSFYQESQVLGYFRCPSAEIQKV